MARNDQSGHRRAHRRLHPPGRNQRCLLPYGERVDHALQVLLASKPWTAPQRDWLKRIAAQTKANLLVDLEALDDPDLIFKREGGGFKRLNKIFDGELQQVLEGFNESLWQPAAA